MNRRYFTDTSSNNGPVDLAAYAKAGHRLIGIKATEGQSYSNPHHANTALAAHSHGLVVIHYHFCRPRGSADVYAEARNFMRHTGPVWQRGDIAVLDLEVRPGEPGFSAARYLLLLANHIEVAHGIKVYVYTGLAYLQESKPALRVGSRMFWIADYGAVPPRLGLRRHRWAHQFSDGQIGAEPHEAAGIGKCDMSRLTSIGLADLAIRRTRRRRHGLKVAR